MSSKKPAFWLYFSALAICGGLPLVAASVVLLLSMRTAETGLLWAVPAGLLVVMLPGAVLVARYLLRPAAQLVSGMNRALSRIGKVEDKLDEVVSPSLLDTTQAGAEFHDIEDSWRQMAIALLDRHNRLEAIFRMGQTITNQLDYSEALNQVLSAVAQVVPYDAAEIIRYENNTLTVAAWRGTDVMVNTTGRNYRYGEGLTGMIAATRTSLWAPTVGAGDPDIRRTLEQGDSLSELVQRTHKVVINSLLGIPLLVEDELIGVLTMVHHEPRHFTLRHKHLLETLAGQASIAIHNALAIERRESALQARIHDLEIRIDEAQKQKEVQAIVGTDYFKGLRQQGRFFRERSRRRRHSAASPTTAVDESATETRTRSTEGSGAPTRDPGKNDPR